MIQSIIDNDLYKLTMQNAVIKLFPAAKVRYQFINRGNTKFPDGFSEILRKEIAKMGGLSLTMDEKEYLFKKCYFLDPTYMDFLMGYKFDPSEVGVIQKGGDLQVLIEGYWYRTILWEVPLMALISELYFKMANERTFEDSKILDLAKEKATRFNLLGVSVADFGTRRRYSFQNHDRIVGALKTYGRPSFVGSSNVYFAKKYDVTPIGTHAHEWFMFHGAQFGYKIANRLALENWINVYRGDLGIALSDTYTSEVFFRNFDTKFAKLFDGVRQDSGDPIEFAKKTIEHYMNLRIDPISKTIIFSDGLNPGIVEEIANFCRNKIKISFGIGTNFTNDVGVKPLNIVIKMIEAKTEGQEWVPTIKLSDNNGKHTGDEASIKLCKSILNIKE
jgi:nicotinate phosphoribosyltransferase